MEDEKILRNWENSIQIRLLWNVTSELCVQKKSADALSEEGGASTPTAPEGVRALIILSCYCGRPVGGTLCETGDRSALDSTKVNRTARSASLANFWTCHFWHVDCALRHSRSSGLELRTRRDVLDSHEV